jgi:hypothetical protein
MNNINEKCNNKHVLFPFAAKKMRREHSASLSIYFVAWDEDTNSSAAEKVCSVIFIFVISLCRVTKAAFIHT